MNARRGFLVATLCVALSHGGMALADAPAGAPAQSEPTAEQAAAVTTPTQVAAPAAQQATPLQPAARVSGPATGNTSGMISGLIFLLLLVLGAAWLIRRTGGMPALRGGSSMKVVAALSVGPRERVVLIELGGQQWLLGVSGGSVNALHHFEQPVVVGGNDDFAGKLRQLWPQGVGPGAQGPGK